jgi:hypothetical protein
MIAAGNGERGRNRSEYAVRKQGHGQLLAEWLRRKSRRRLKPIVGCNANIRRR